MVQKFIGGRISSCPFSKGAVRIADRNRALRDSSLVAYLLLLVGCSALTAADTVNLGFNFDVLLLSHPLQHTAMIGGA